MIKKWNSIKGFKIWVLSWVLIDKDSFCLDCFLKFFIKNKSELNILKSIDENITIYVKNILFTDFPSLNKNFVYLKNEYSKKKLILDMTYHRHPHCLKHNDKYFLNTKFIYNETINLVSQLDISTYSIELDKEIYWENWIIKYIDFNNSSTSLSHNPLSFLYNNEDLFFICSWYKKWMNTKTLSKRIAIMEWIERFLEFSYCNKLLIKKTKLKNNIYLKIQYLDLNKYIPVFNNKSLFSKSKFLLPVYDILNDKEFYVDSNLVLIDQLSSVNIINSTWWSVHFNFKLSILNWIKELIERDSLMKMWLYKYTPEKYDISLVSEDDKNIFNEISNNFSISLYKIKSIYWFTTLAFAENKNTKTVKPIFIYWSSHSFSENKSISWAISELYITYNNLSKYDFNKIDKTEVNTVMDHYYYYQDKEKFKLLSFIFENNNIIDNYMEEDLLSENKDFTKIIWNIPFKFYVFNLTPEFLFKKWIFATKVITEDLQSMDFWYYNLKISNKIKLSDISKDSLLEPHPFF